MNKYIRNGPNAGGKSVFDYIEDLGSGSGSGGNVDLSGYYTKGQSDSRYVTGTTLTNTLVNYVQDSELAGVSNLSNYRTSVAQDNVTSNAIQSALATSSQQFIEVFGDTRISGNPVSGTNIVFTQNQISPAGSSIFTLVTNNKVRVSQTFQLRILLQVQFDENGAGNQTMSFVPSWDVLNPCVFGITSTIDPSMGFQREYITTTTANQELSIRLDFSGILAFASEWISWRVQFTTLGFNSSIFTPASNLQISQIDNLPASLTAKYTIGTALDMNEQAITSVGGITLSEGYRISEPGVGLLTPASYADEHYTPKGIVAQMIEEIVESGGGQDTILSTGTTTALTVRDQPSQLLTLTNGVTESISIGIPGAISTFNIGQLNFTTLQQNWILYDDVTNFESASGFALCPKSYVDQMGVGGGVSLASVLEYQNDETANIVLDSHIPNKLYVDNAISSAGAGFDISNAPLIRYDAGIDNTLISSDLRNLVTVDWVQSNANVGDIYTLSRLNQLGNATYQLNIDNNGRLTYKNTTLPRTFLELDTDASNNMNLDMNLVLSNSYSISGANAVSIVSPHTLFSEYGNTELVAKEHIQQYIDDIQASNASNAIVSTQSNLQKLVITGAGDITSELRHTMFAASTNTNTDTLVCQADSGDGNQIKYQFNESWPKLNQSLASVNAQTDSQILVPKQYVDQMIMPKISNRKVNSSTNNVYSIWTVNHGLNTTLSNLITSFYVVLTTAKGNHPVGTIFQMHELSYVGNTATDSYGWQVFSIAGDNNNVKVKMLSAGYGSVANATTSALVSIEYNEADLYCNIISVGNNLMSQVQTSVQTSKFSISEQNTNLVFKNTQNNLELFTHNGLGDVRYVSDVISFQSLNNGLLLNGQDYFNIYSPDFSTNCCSVYSAAGLNTINLKFNGNIEYSGNLVSITASSKSYKQIKLMSDHFEDFMQKKFPPVVWFKYNSDFRDQFDKTSDPFIGWCWEDLDEWDPTRKFKLIDVRDTKDRFGKMQQLKTVNENRVIYFQLAQQQYKIDKLQEENDLMKEQMKRVMQRLDVLENGEPQLNRTFDTQSNMSRVSVKLDQKVGGQLKKKVIGKIDLK